MSLTSTVSGSGSCVAIGMNGASTILTGCTQIPFMHDQVVKQYQNDTQNQTDPFYKVYPRYVGQDRKLQRLVLGHQPLDRRH